MNPIFILLLFFFSALTLRAEEVRLTELDEKVIEVFDEYGHGWEPVRYPKEHPYWKELQWYRDQGDKVRPGLMYLLTETYKGDFTKMSKVVAGLETTPGDPSDVLNYTRIHLPVMLDTEQAYGKSGYIQSCLHVLSKFGGPEDMRLINLFLDYHDVTVRSTAMTQAKNLQDRIDAGEFEKPKVRRKPLSNASIANHEEKSGTPRSPNHENISSQNSAPMYGWILVTLILLAVALIGWRKISARGRR